MNITVILPIHKIDETIYPLVKKAIESYESAKTENTTLLLVASDEAKNYTNSDGKTIEEEFGYKIVVSENTSFTAMVNLGSTSCETEYFTVLEFDDVFTKNVFRNTEKYANSGFEASVYLPLTEVVDFKSGESFGYINEAVLASAFSEELNYLDFNCMEDFPEMNYTGAIFKLSDFKSAGGLKESMKLHFWHEYILRALNLGQKMFVVPKIGYKHIVNREGSFYDTIKDNMSANECAWWFDLAKKEYFFKKDRQKVYE